MVLTVIITDDDPVAQFMHTLLIKKSGLSIKPLTFSNARDTLTYLREQCASPEGSEKKFLILLDINMPEMSGWELLDSIVENGYKNIFAVMVSSSVNADDYQKAKDYKAVVGYLEKPLSETKIITLVESDQYRSAFEI